MATIVSRATRAAALLAFAACTTTPSRNTPEPLNVVANVRNSASGGTILIRHARIIDGTGSPWYRGDILVAGDRIAAVGNLQGATAADTIDATGLVASPGFIDMLGHSEYSLLRDGRAISKITQGITTEITGEVFSVAPVNQNTMADQDSATRASVTWTDLTGYFQALDKARPAINLATFVTVGSLRRYVMGDASRPATGAELTRMEALVEQAMQQGAMGLSSGLIYAPASFAPTSEVVALAKVAARHGGGYASHIRSEGDRLVDAVKEAIDIGEQSGTWVQIHHLKASGRKNWGKVRDAVAEIDAARARGVDVSADQYPYVASGTGLSNTLPGWVHAGGTDSLLARLHDPETRARLRKELSGNGAAGSEIGSSSGGPGGVMLANVTVDSLRVYQGRRLDEIARARKQDPVDALFDILSADKARAGAIYFSMSEDDVDYVMRQPWVSVGIDAGARAADSTIKDHPHPRAYGAFPRILCHYVRERHVLTLEDAVRKFTALPAARMGLDARGVLKAGMAADITLFDPATVCDRATFVDPVQTSVGITHVLVNGVPVVRNGAVTGARPGRGLRRR